MLARYQQTSRYPGSPAIPEGVLANLDEVERIIRCIEREAEESGQRELFDLRKFLIEYGKPSSVASSAYLSQIRILKVFEETEIIS